MELNFAPDNLLRFAPVVLIEVHIADSKTFDVLRKM